METPSVQGGVYLPKYIKSADIRLLREE